MNLRHEKSGEATTQTTQTPPGKPWYLQQPETTETAEAKVTAVSAQPLRAVQEPQSHHQPLFEPSAAERILARAGALQEVHGQMLSREQIEVIAAEVGIKPEFVRLAIEQEKSGVVPEPQKTMMSVEQRGGMSVRRIAGALSAYGTLTAVCITASINANSIGGIVLAGLVWPVVLALTLGILSRNPRKGAVSGAVLAITYNIAVVASICWMGQMSAPFWGPLGFLILTTIGGALLGLIGAQVRRVVSRRQASNRSNRSNWSRRTVIRERAL